MAINPDLTRLRKEIQRLLADKRPDRYTVSDTTHDAEPDIAALLEDEHLGDAWLDEIADEVTALVPDEEVRRLYARKIVGQEEGRATRKTNDFLRKVRSTGQIPLTYFDAKDDPVAVFTRIDTPKRRPRIKHERVALRAMAALDFRAFAIEERRRAAGDFASRHAACEAAEWIAEKMIAAGAARFDLWVKEEPPDDGDGGAAVAA